MKTLSVNESEAKLLYKTGNKLLKQKLETTYGKEFFSTKKKPQPKVKKLITDIVVDYESACKYAGIAPKKFAKSVRKDIVAYEKLTFIAQVLNEGWTPNWSDSNEKKWYAWFNFNGGSGAFVYSTTDCVWTGTFTNGGSRLRFKSSGLAEHCGKNFVALWNDFLLI